MVAAADARETLAPDHSQNPIRQADRGELSSSCRDFPVMSKHQADQSESSIFEEAWWLTCITSWRAANGISSPSLGPS